MTTDDAALAWGLLRRAATATISHVNDELIETRGMPLHEVELMAALHAARHPIAMTQLAEMLRLHKSTVTRSVNRLESEGWVEREASTQDGRLQLARLTREGRDLYRRLVPAYERAIRRHFSRWMTESDITALTRALGKVAD